VVATPATGDLFWVDAVVKNDRVDPTFSDRSLQLKRAALAEAAREGGPVSPS